MGRTALFHPEKQSAEVEINRLLKRADQQPMPWSGPRGKIRTAGAGIVGTETRTREEVLELLDYLHRKWRPIVAA